MERTHNFKSLGHRPELAANKQINQMKDDPHPGLELDYADSADSLEKEKIRQHKEDHCNKVHGEYGPHNARFWYFMFAILAVSVLLYMSLAYSLRKDEHKNKEGFNEAILLGFIIFFLLTGFTAYHHYKNKNGRSFRYSIIFCMILIWGFSLWWSVLFYPQTSTRDASVALMFAIIFLIGWIALSIYQEVYDYLYFLIIALIWLVGVLWMNISSFKKNDCDKNNKLPRTISSCGIGFRRGRGRKTRKRRKWW